MVALVDSTMIIDMVASKIGDIGDGRMTYLVMVFDMTCFRRS